MDDAEVREIAQFWVKSFRAGTGGDAATLANAWLQLRIREAALEAQLAEAKADLLRYGEHRINCNAAMYGSGCTCGWSARYAELHRDS